jgi:CRISPR-associated protein Csm2
MNNFKSDWITSKIDHSMVEWAQSLAEKLAGGDEKTKMTTSQLRKFFGNLKRIQGNFDMYKEEITLLKPKLAYSVGKDKNTNISLFYKSIEPGLDIISKSCTELEFHRFVSIIESIVAFHRYFGGK